MEEAADGLLPSLRRYLDMKLQHQQDPESEDVKLAHDKWYWQAYQFLQKIIMSLEYKTHIRGRHASEDVVDSVIIAFENMMVGGRLSSGVNLDSNQKLEAPTNNKTSVEG